MVTATKTAPRAAEKLSHERSGAPRMSRRRRKMRSVAFARTVICVLAGIFLLGYVGLYAQVTLYGYRRAELSKQIRQTEMENQALRAEIQTLSSPDRIAAAAAAAGMQPSNAMVYIAPSDAVKVARAE